MAEDRDRRTGGARDRILERWLGAEQIAMGEIGRRGRCIWVLAKIGLAGGLVVFYLLAAPTSAAQQVITAEADVQAKNMFASEFHAIWSGSEAWDVRFLGPGMLLATAGPWNLMTFRDLTGTRPAWTLGDVGAVRSGQRSAGSAWPYAFSPDGTLLAGDLGGSTDPSNAGVSDATIVRWYDKSEGRS
jgi:hypothetical protein